VWLASFQDWLCPNGSATPHLRFKQNKNKQNKDNNDTTILARFSQFAISKKWMNESLKINFKRMQWIKTIIQLVRLHDFQSWLRPVGAAIPHPRFKQNINKQNKIEQNKTTIPQL